MLNMADTINVGKLVDFHFNSLQGMYFSEYIPGDGFVLLFSDLVEDSYYNYVAQVTKSVRDVLDQVRQPFNQRNRTVALYVTPDSYLYEKGELIPSQLTSWATDAWMVLDNPVVLREYKMPATIVVEPVDKNQRSEYVRTFEISYGSDDPDDPYANLPGYYGMALSRSFDHSPSDFKKEYVWAKVDGSPVGIGCMLWDNEIAGIYGVGTFVKYRTLGVGTSLMAYMARKAWELNLSTIMLQTESGSKVEQWYSNMGFKTAFLGRYLTEHS